MKKNFLNFFILIFATFTFIFPALADGSPDITNGESIFTANCLACHANGNNVIVPAKTLKKEILDENNMFSPKAVTYQVTNGKNAMPAFGGRLSEDDIRDVAGFVLSQSEKGWD
ncbi:unnamed protein product [Discosporangium mesarthrocarpum]